MSSKNLSSVATDVITAYGITATNVINTYRFGGERIAGYVDERFATVLNSRASMLRKDIRSNLIGNQQRVSGYYVRGVHFGTDRAQGAVGVAVDLANKGVNLVASNAVRLDRAANLNALDTLSRVAMPAANVVSKVADRIEEGSSKLVTRVSGKPVPAKAVATRKLSATTRQAAVTRKRVTKTATKQVNAATKEVNKQVKTATKRVSKAVADTATSTSNAARRVARKAKATAKAA